MRRSRGRGEDLRAVLVVRAELVVVALGGGASRWETLKSTAYSMSSRARVSSFSAFGVCSNTGGSAVNAVMATCGAIRGGMTGGDATGGQFGVDGSIARGGQIWAPRGVLGHTRIRARSGRARARRSRWRRTLRVPIRDDVLAASPASYRLPERLQGLGRGREVRHLPFSVQTFTQSTRVDRLCARRSARAWGRRAASSVSWRGFAPNLVGQTHEPLVVSAAGPSLPVEVVSSRSHHPPNKIRSVGHRPARIETRGEWRGSHHTRRWIFSYGHSV